jgi:uncharacterized protein (TIGR00299 family) protein
MSAGEKPMDKSNRIAYLDCFSGASGDMLLGALLDAGLPLEALRADLAHLPLADYEVTAERVTRRGLAGTQFTVIDHGAGRPARHLPAIRALLEAGDLPERVRNQSLAIFERLAAAEAAVHGTTIDQIHFHELGAVDSLVDIVGFVSGLARLGVDRLYASPLPLGSGTIEAEHGRLPVPAPATLAILAEVGAPTVASDALTELVTPTGAVLLAHLATFASRRPTMRLERIGYGVGQKTLPWANVLRIWLGTSCPETPGLTDAEQDQVALLATNLDDATGEVLGYVMERLLTAGALDVWFTPIQMKKNRPAVTLSLLCEPGDQDVMVRILLAETTTLGVRVALVTRAKAGRREVKVATPWGPVRVKLKLLGEEVVDASPEYEDCARAARAAGVPLAQVVASARANL